MLGRCSEEGLLVTWWLCVNFLRNIQTVFPSGRTSFPVISMTVDNSHSKMCEGVSTEVLIFISPISGEVEHLFVHLLAIRMSSLEKYVIKPSAYLLIACVLGVELCTFFIP